MMYHRQSGAKTQPLAKPQMSETFFTGATLAIVGGLLDVYTYLCRGHVFANAQTGNIVLLGVRLAQGDFAGSLRYFASVFSFVLGVIVCEAVRARYGDSQKIHWRQIILCCEILVLTIVAFLPLGTYDTLANILVSFTCSLQTQCFRKIGGNAYASTMCTGNLRSATEALYLYRRKRDKALLRNSTQYYGVILFFVLGAAMGTVLMAVCPWYSVAPLCACILLMVVFLGLFYNQN